MNFVGLFRTVLRPNNLYTNSVRYIAGHPIKFVETQNRWRERDDIPQRYFLVYKGPMEKWLKLLSTYLTVSSGSIFCLSTYHLAFNNLNSYDNPIVVGDIILANSVYESLTYLSCFIGFHVALKLLLSRFLVRLYQDGDNYIAVFRGHFYNDIRKHEFKRNEVVKLSTRFLTTWPDARYSLGKKHAIILDHYFKTPEHFNYLVTKLDKADPNRSDD